MQEPWFRKQTWSWYIELADGSQHRLGKHPGDDAPRKTKKGWNPPPEILERWHGVMADKGLAPPPKNPTVKVLCDDFLTACHGEVSPDTHDWYRVFLQDFCTHHPGLKSSAITEDHVRKWLKAPRKRLWGQSTKRSAITILKRAYNWAVKARRLDASPIAHLEKPSATRRERLLFSEEKATILSWFPEGDPFRDLLVALTEAGVRPGEAMKVEAADVDLNEGTWIIRGKTGKKRVIYLTPTLVELTTRLCEKYPTGPIFRNADGNPWNRQAVRDRFRRKQKSQGLDKAITAYVYRGTWATEALENGVPDAVVQARFCKFAA